jgi:hypothetical protein
MEQEACARGDAEFYRMKRPPYQFITTDYWGMGPD